MLLGILRGVGKQSIGAVLNIIAFYVIGLPMAWIFCFYFNFRVSGLMMGIAFGTLFQVLTLLVVILVFETSTYTSNIVKSEHKHMLLLDDSIHNKDDNNYNNNSNNSIDDDIFDDDIELQKSVKEIEMIKINKISEVIN